MLNLFDNLSFTHYHNKQAMLILGDSLEILKNMQSRSINLIFADPPYGIGKDFGVSKDLWDSPQKYLSWCKIWIDECMRILKDNGTMYLMSSTQHMPFIVCYVSQKYFVINQIIWTYDSAGVQPKNKFSSGYEPILMITHSKNTKYTFNRNDILIEAKTGAKRGLMDYRKNPPQPYSHTKIPSNVWHFNRVRYKMNEYENHPTQKPEGLLNRIILASSNKGDVVLDPFSGSFSTSKVAMDLERKTIGIELNEDYFKIGLRRCGISGIYQGEELIKHKPRKTNNKSKKDHCNITYNQLF